MNAEKIITTKEVGKINRHNIYSYIYDQKYTSKQTIADALHLSLSTVTQSLQFLESQGIIKRESYFDSTGGRKAQKIEVVKDARIAVGIGILKDTVHLTAVDLAGNILKNQRFLLSFAAEDSYYRKLGELVSDFIQDNQWNDSQILGAGIAIQGIVSADNKEVKYGRILNNGGLKLEDLAQYLPCRSLLFHDVKAASFAELWNLKDLRDAVVLLLNNNMGGALILNREIHYGEKMFGGLIEHMSFSPDGPLCHCGSRGCLETYLSANVLRQKAGCDLDIFFSELRAGVPQRREVWKEYLDNLAFAIRNLQVLMDSPIIISGLLNGYMIQEDYDYLKNALHQSLPFPSSDNPLIAGQYGTLAPAIGSALFFVKDWLEQICL